MAIKECRTFNELKKALREILKYLQDTGTRMTGSGAHMVDIQPQQEEQQPQDEQGEDSAVPAMIATMQKLGFDEDTVLAAVQSFRTKWPKGGQRGAKLMNRISTPPREPKDNKCANCNKAGRAHAPDVYSAQT